MRHTRQAIKWKSVSKSAESDQDREIYPSPARNSGSVPKRQQVRSRCYDRRATPEGLRTDRLGIRPGLACSQVGVGRGGQCRTGAKACGARWPRLCSCSDFRRCNWTFQGGRRPPGRLSTRHAAATPPISCSAFSKLPFRNSHSARWSHSADINSYLLLQSLSSNSPMPAARCMHADA